MRKIAVVAAAVVISSIITMTQAEAEMNNHEHSQSLWVIADKYDTTITNMKKAYREKSAVIHCDESVDGLLMKTEAFQQSAK
ncbi:hypothetical protein [Macrococcus equipercicus]|uniref:Uncharacterized protein n=1 Tax=Macrococcus equipercicus TaxID=69967 RepID=A0A9Q9BN22_9STAP|nr:hypothetical protein [Macrococcus equipercicus]KAA1039240.1 hypothetical protein ERX35_006615 [Macrococcus equipercicus]UTH13530.1 hypothetical protein KFV11_09945 [Macrococcus equipercicus]